MLKNLTVYLLLFIFSSGLMANTGWSLPKFSTDPSDIGHIFRNESGHLRQDTSENRAFIESACESLDNKVGTKTSGSEIYLKTMPDGSQAWAEVRNNTIRNGGKNNFPKEWVADSSKDGGHFTTPKFTRYKPDLETFKEHLAINRIKNTYEKSRQIPDYPSLDASNLQGISGKYGKILNLAIKEREGTHTFYLPTSEISEAEALQILREVARGIYVYRNLPFFSLHFNGSLTSYPVIPPSYRHTLVGEALGMLDYYMKGFDNGRFFEKKFIENWNATREKSQQYLIEHAIDFHEYCENLGLSYRSFDEIIKDLMGDEASKIISTHTLDINRRLIFKQNAIYKNGTSLSYEGGFNVIWELEETPTTDKEEKHYGYLKEACELMNAQIEELLPQLPICKKYFEILYLANFFSYYCNSLKEVNKIPLLERDLSGEIIASCPQAFPPIPFNSSGELRISFISLFESMEQTQLNQVIDYFKATVSSDEAKAAAYGLVYEQIEDCLEPLLTVDQCSNLTLEVLEFCKTQFQSYYSDAIIILGPAYYGALTDENIRNKFFQKLNSIIANAKGRNKQDWIAIKDGMIKWFENPFIACFENLGFLFDPLEGTLIVIGDFTDDHIQVGGGCGVTIEDIEAQNSMWLGYFHRGTSVQIAYDNMEVDDDDSPEAVAKGYLYPPLPGYPLDNDILSILDAISNEDFTLFKERDSKIEDWDFKDSFNISLVHHASKCKSPSILQSLIQKEANLKVFDSQGLSPLHYAAMVDSEACIKVLLKHCPELLDLQGEDGQTPLFSAVQYRAYNAVHTLLSAGADPNRNIINDLSPLLWAIQSKNYHVAMRLLAHPDINIHYYLKDKRSALEFAIEMKQTQILRQLIECGANVNRDYCGCTPLHLSIMSGYIGGVKALLECSDTVLVAKSLSGETPIEIAQRLGHDEIVNMLVKSLERR